MEANKRILITGGSGFIGTNLIDKLIEEQWIVLNIDIKRPLNEKHLSWWRNVDILDFEHLNKVIDEFKPEIIIHLAARTDTESENLDDYKVNTEGTLNLVRIIEQSSFVKRFVNTSTQYVYKSKTKPFADSNNEFNPHTVYGISKKIAEEYTFNSNINCIWTIVRPVNIWGPWHMRYPNELWQLIDRGLYFHTTTKQVVRTYGYVKNVVHQLYQIILAPKDKVDKKVFYLGDLPIDSYEWINCFAKVLNGRKILRIPKIFFFPIAIVGDLIIKAGFSFPIYSVRLRNMIEDYYAPTNVTICEFGISHPNLEDNVKETVSWITGEGVRYFQYWQRKVK
jgi:nucleoside-diphosphate-sugar epimerase